MRFMWYMLILDMMKPNDFLCGPSNPLFSLNSLKSLLLLLLVVTCRQRLYLSTVFGRYYLRSNISTVRLTIWRCCFLSSAFSEEHFLIVAMFGLEIPIQVFLHEVAHLT